MFAAEDCAYPKNVPRTWCPNSGCFFGTYALSNDEYAVVRGCISDFVNDNSENYGRSTCEVGVSSNSVYVDGESAPTPLVGWFTCYLEDNCNSQVVDFELVTRVSRWGYYYDGWKPCTLTSNKNQCLSCQEFDGKGTCKKKSKSYCNGAYCTSTTGKIQW
ncbi:hypothetical protein M3Y97_01062500 [Aphelenchoides bicaudatus]|nr:hypothetical protein M3Y97_01062500 [Aphelenchoides bicaudatus]